ncbi:MAG: hypothetical protein ACRDRJ_32530 [Streptosporangiaceae bacterium]
MLIALAVSRLWKATVSLVGHRRLAVVASIVAAGLAAAVSVQAVAASTAPTFWTPSTAQAERAITVAYLEASSTIPSAAGSPVTSLTKAPPRAGAALMTSAARASFWPPNVGSISYIGTGRQRAQQFLDGSRVPDNRPVIVLRMTGHFSVVISAPLGATPYVTGTVLTAVLDATSGQVLDFGLTNASKLLPGPVVAFRR